MHGDLLLISNVISQFIQSGLNMFVRAISLVLSNLRRVSIERGNRWPDIRGRIVNDYRWLSYLNPSSED